MAASNIESGGSEDTATQTKVLDMNGLRDSPDASVSHSSDPVDCKVKPVEELQISYEGSTTPDVSNIVQDSTETSASQDPKAEPMVSGAKESTTEEPSSSRREFYLVKVPRPDISSTIQAIKLADLKVNEKKEKQQFIRAALVLKQAKRNEALDNFRSAQTQVRALSAVVKAKYEAIRPLQDALKRIRDAGAAANNRRRELACETEEELNYKIAEIEYKIQHESISLPEEKKLLREKTLLEATRPKVRENEALLVSVAGAGEHKDEIQTQLKPLLMEVDALKSQRDAAQVVVDARSAELTAIDGEIAALRSDMAAAHQQLDGAFQELRSLRDEANRKEFHFRTYRQDLAKAQQLVIAKDLDALQDFCDQQIERLHTKMCADSLFWASYIKANERSTIRRFRSYDTRRPGIDEEPVDLVDSIDPPSSSAAASPAIDGLGAAPASVVSTTKPDKKGGTQAGKKEGDVALPTTDPSEQEEATKPAADADASADGASGGGKQAPKKGATVSNKAKTVKPDDEGIVFSVFSAPGGGHLLPEGTALGKKEADAAVLKEQRRQEAVQKAKEAEERKKKAAEKAKAKAAAWAIKEAEEVARRKKEKESRARKKGSGSGNSAVPAETQSESEGEGEGLMDAGTDVAKAEQETAAVAGAASRRQRKRAAVAGKPSPAASFPAVKIPGSISKKRSSAMSNLELVLCVVAVILATIFMTLNYVKPGWLDSLLGSSNTA